MATDNHPNKPIFDWDSGIKRYEESRDALGDNEFTKTMDKVAAGRKAGKAFRKRSMVKRTTSAAKRAMKAPKKFGK